MGPIIFILAAASLLPALDASIVKRQTEECPDTCRDQPMELSFILDSSSSIWGPNFTMSLWFVEEFVKKFDIGQDKVRVSFVTYGDRVYSEQSFNFNTYSTKTQLGNAIGSTDHKHGSSTETGMAIDWFLDNQAPQARAGTRHVLIVLTDGNSQKPDMTKAAAARAANQGLEVFAIGVGINVTEQELHNIASDGRHVFMVGSYQMLEDIMMRLAYETCNVDPVPLCQFDPVDLALVIDSSVSIREENFPLGLEFIKEFLDPFQINPSSIRVAAVMFADRVYTEKVIPFDMYTNKLDTQDAIRALPYMAGSSTETGQGIDYMVQNFLPHTRPHAAHIGIVITDGQSQNKWGTREAAQRARTAGFTMYAVGIGSGLNEEELEGIAGDPSRVLLADSYATLINIKAALIDKTCVGINLSIQEQRMSFSPTQN